MSESDEEDQFSEELIETESVDNSSESDEELVDNSSESDKELVDNSSESDKELVDNSSESEEESNRKSTKKQPNWRQLDKKAGNCVICLDYMADTLFSPCMHRCMCKTCFNVFQEKSEQKCPVCRESINEVLC